MEGVLLKYILDTAPWINAVTMPQVLPARIRDLLSVSDVKAVATVSLLEASILHRLGRFAFSGPIDAFFSAALSTDLRLLDLSPRIAAETNRLPDTFHGDPFDRTIVATAIVHNLTLITADEQIRESGACSVEFYPFRPVRTRRSK